MGDKRIEKPRKKKRVIKGRDDDEVLAHLVELARQLDITVRQEKGDFTGGGCRVENERLIFLKKMDPARIKIEILLKELVKLDFEHIPLDPVLHQYMNQLKKVVAEEETNAKN